MTILTFDMLKAGLDAFTHHDASIARNVIPRDKEVDALDKAVHQTLTQYMIERPDTIKVCLHWMVVSKSVERIADHAPNIAEDVVYLYATRIFTTRFAAILIVSPVAGLRPIRALRRAGSAI